MSASAMQGGHN